MYKRKIHKMSSSIASWINSAARMAFSTGGVKSTPPRTAAPRRNRTTFDHAGFCAPDRIPHYDQYGTCYTREELVQLIELYNKTTGHEKHAIAVEEQDTPATLLQKLVEAEQALRTSVSKCTSAASATIQGADTRDLCVLESPFVKQRASHLYRMFKNNVFRPPKPSKWYKNPREWLNTYDILNVFEQYEKYDPTFKMLGVVPIDWAKGEGSAKGACIAPDVCKTRIADLRANGKTDFGIVWNLDPHTQSGSHWVSAFCHFVPDDPKFGICYFDSVAAKPPKQVVAFMKSVRDQIRELLPEHADHFCLKYNIDRKQFQNTECGMFSSIFIMLCNEHPGLTYQEVCDLIHRDKDMVELRDRIYTPAVQSASAEHLGVRAYAHANKKRSQRERQRTRKARQR